MHTGDVLSPYLGGSEAKLRGLFAQARQAAPCILFFDELDCLASNRDSSGGEGDAGSVYSRLLSTLLNEMDGVGGDSRSDKHVLVLAATNRREAIDAALLRPGRLEESVYIPLPHSNDYEAITHVALRGVPLEPQVDVGEVSRRLEKGGKTMLSGADIVAVCREAAMEALRESVDCRAVGMRHFERAMDSKLS